ncbi:hypothetical protein AB0J80_13310 [Actinoplanes sp. NPDC049548]
MSARRLSRFAGLVLIVAALVGGTAGAVSAQQSPTDRAAVSALLLDLEWN